MSWTDVQLYMAWLSKATGRAYRLLTEGAGRDTDGLPLGDEIGSNNADCAGCASKWDATQPAPAGSFKPNQFGLYDVVGNVWEWVEDCLHVDYSHAPTDGSAWMIAGDCNHHRLRGGSWASVADEIRSANRSSSATSDRLSIIGFRVGRSLEP